MAARTASCASTSSARCSAPGAGRAPTWAGSISARAAATTRRRAADWRRGGHGALHRRYGQRSRPALHAQGGNGAEIVPPGHAAEPARVAVRGTRLPSPTTSTTASSRSTPAATCWARRRGPGRRPRPAELPLRRRARPAGPLFVADDLNHRVVRYSDAAHRLPVQGPLGLLRHRARAAGLPARRRHDANGELFVANTGNDRSTSSTAAAR